MQISVTGRHLDITDAIRDYASDKVAHGLADFTRVESVHVILDVEKYRHIAEIVVQAKNHIRVDARDESDDMYASIDSAVDKAQKQLRRLRDKIQDHKSREKLAHIELEMKASEEVADDET
jgi:putative sigma-54 modulation protein